jgi:hypothetical protein
MVGSPYRLLAVRPREPPSPHARGILARRGATRSVLPFAVIVLAFFLPAAKDCDAVVSPADLSLQSIGWFAWLAPTYFGAGFLLATVVHARIGQRTPANTIAAIALGAVIGSSGVIAVGSLFGTMPIAVVAFVPFAGAILCAVRARRRAGWMRFAAIADGWLLGSAPVAAINVATGGYYGAYLFILAFASLVVLRVVTWAAMFRAKCEWESLERQDIRAPSLRG